MTNPPRSPRPPPRGAGATPRILRPLSVVILSAGEYDLSPTRVLAEKIARALTASFAARSTRAEVQVLELHRLTVDLAQHAVLGYSSLDLREAVADVAAADALAVVAPQVGTYLTWDVDRFLEILGDEALSGTPVLLATHPVLAAGAGQAIHRRLVRSGAALVPPLVVAGHTEFGSPIDQAAADLATATAPQ